MRLKAVIGLEIHIELGTEAKMFCTCPAEHFAKASNTQVCPVCLGLPGALPVPNQRAIEWTVLTGLAFGCRIPNFSKFDRKHYFYPDLPKGYQISQYDLPFCVSGIWTMENGQKIRVERVHLEEDTGRLIHTRVGGEAVTLIDFNRSGVPLIEIVTEPDLPSASASREFLQEIQHLVRWIGVSDADMEKGSMRLEANVSLAKEANKLPDYKVEIKNINSFKFVEQAVNFEIKRQEELFAAGKKPVQETRGFDEKTGKTRGQRYKEEEKDYRYFPEPDIPPIRWRKKEIEAIKKKLPELPGPRRKRFAKEYQLPVNYIRVLTRTRRLADFFEEAVEVGEKHGVLVKKIADTMVNKKPNIEKILPAKLIEILREEEKRPVLSIKQLEQAIVQSIEQNPKAVEDYKEGKEAALEFLVGKVMKKTRGQVVAEKTRKLIKEKLKS